MSFSAAVVDDHSNADESLTEDNVSTSDYSTSDEETSNEDKHDSTNNTTSSSSEDDVSTSSEDEASINSTSTNASNDRILLFISSLIIRVRKIIGLVHKSAPLGEYIGQQAKEKKLPGEVCIS